MTTIVELPQAMKDPMRREANKGLMVAWINARLLERCDNDVRKSFVLYDEHGLFEYALPAGFDLTDEVKAKIFAGTPIRFWSKGI